MSQNKGIFDAVQAAGSLLGPALIADALMDVTKVQIAYDYYKRNMILARNDDDIEELIAGGYMFAERFLAKRKTIDDDDRTDNPEQH